MLSNLSAVQSPTTIGDWLDSDSDSVSSSEDEPASNSQHAAAAGGDDATQNKTDDDKLKDGVDAGEATVNDEDEEIDDNDCDGSHDGEEDEDTDKESEDRHDNRSDGFSATEVGLYFEAIAEATVDELLEILHDEGLVSVRTLSAC